MVYKIQQPEFAQLVSQRSAETLKDASARLGENSSEGAFARGNVFELAAYYEQAEESYREALSMDQGNYQAAARLALVQLKGNKSDKALRTASNLAAQNPGLLIRELTTNENVSALTILGDALVSNGRVEDAVEAYQAALKASGKDTFAAGRLAQIFLSTGEPKKALDLGKSFASNPRFSTLSSVLALGKTSEALLPRFKRESLVDAIRVAMPGRPLLVDGTPRFAPVVEDGGAWCEDTSTNGAV
jgi:tetratricopeptide (TPR) repeat protein